MQWMRVTLNGLTPISQGCLFGIAPVPSPQQHPVEPQAVIEANRASVSLHHIQALPPAKVFDGHGSKLDSQVQ